MSFYETVEKVYADWNYGHPRIIHSFLRSLKPDVHVDCGTYRGLSAAWAAKAMQDNNKGKVICLDDFSLREHVERYGDPRQHLEGNLRACGIDGWVEMREGNTFDDTLWPDQVDTCYVDAFHSFAAAENDFYKAVERGAYFVALDDTENCVGPRMLVERLSKLAFIKGSEWQVLDLHTDNGLTIFLKKQPRRLITFSQELPLPNSGVDLRPLTLDEKKAHFDEASAITGLDYSSILGDTEHV